MKTNVKDLIDYLLKIEHPEKVAVNVIIECGSGYSIYSTEVELDLSEESTFDFYQLENGDGELTFGSL